MKKRNQLEPKLTPLPCPFCGKVPEVFPKNPEVDGNGWGSVHCTNKKCSAKPLVDDGILFVDERGPGACKDAAIRRWNERPTPKPQ